MPMGVYGEPFFLGIIVKNAMNVIQFSNKTRATQGTVHQHVTFCLFCATRLNFNRFK